VGVEFDPYNKWILITAPTTDITALEIYSEAMDWSDDPENLDSSPPMYAYGKFPLGGGADSDSIFVINASDGWKIKPYNGNYQLIVRGTIITDDESPRNIPPDSGVVVIVYQVSSQGIIVDTGGGGTSAWDALVSSHDTPGTFGAFVGKKLLTLAKYIGLK